MRILLIDNSANAHLIIEALTIENWTCEVARFGDEGVELAKYNNFDMIILDLILPDINGYEVLSRLRSFKIKIPVLVLSAMNKVKDIVDSFNNGADGYLAKPFHKDELIARIKAIVRRCNGHSETVVRFGKVSINFDNRVVTVNDKPLHLPNKEYAILELLAKNKGSVVTKENFLKHLYNDLDKRKIQSFSIFLCKLRQKLAEVTGSINYIETVHKQGYLLNEHELE
jgi:DNA-binding response OmpR family regulator